MMSQQNKTQRQTRSGISIIEVLTSIVVAMIGVFGVMVMIPFAVSQAQQGLDQEKATSLALNAVNEFEIRNYIDTTQWMQVSAAGVLGGIGNNSGRSYVIDPMGVAARATATPGRASGFFPFLHPTVEAAMTPAGSYTYVPNMGAPITFTGNPDQNVLLERVTIDSAAATWPLRRLLANQNFSWSNELVTNEPDMAEVGNNASYPEADLAPPKQVLDAMTDGTLTNRQVVRDMEYLVVATPNDVSPSSGYQPTGVADRVMSWRNYFVVYKDRPQPVELGVATGPEAYDRVFEVKSPLQQANENGGAPPADPDSYRLSIGGGDLEMIEVMPAATVEYSSQRSEIRRGDWMMLTNVNYNPYRSRYFQQINFYKVLDADFEDTNGNRVQDPGESWSVSLQGPDFDFFDEVADTGLVDYFPPAWPTAPAMGDPGCSVVYDTTVTAPTPPFQIRPSRTFAVHLPNVWAVFERTYR